MPLVFNKPTWYVPHGFWHIKTPHTNVYTYKSRALQMCGRFEQNWAKYNLDKIICLNHHSEARIPTLKFI